MPSKYLNMMLSILLTSVVVHLGAAFPLDEFSGIILTRQEDVLAAYDYVVVGGGTSGLTVANRLSEDRKTTVLVIEAGALDNGTETILIPQHISIAGVGNQWPLWSETEEGLGNRIFEARAGRIVGGGSAINGMQFDRGAPGDYDIWGDLIGDPNWGWKGMLPYFKKSETFTPPPPEQAARYNITWDMSYHGTSGPIQNTFPPHIYEHTYNFITACTQVGLPRPKDGNGNAIGVFWTPTSIHPQRRERSYAGNTHYVTANSRPNFHMITQTLATKLVSKNKFFTGVEFVEYDKTLTSMPPGIKKHTVNARKEIIMAAGTAATPKILQLSGIGPKYLLNKLGINQILDLPGVGENFQDHSGGPFAVWNMPIADPVENPATIFLNSTYAAETLEEYRRNRTGPWTVSSPNSLAFLRASDMDFPASIFEAASQQSPGQYLLPHVHPKVVRGFERQKKLALKYFEAGRMAVQETSMVGGAGFLSNVAHPLSRGRIAINSTDPFRMPSIKWNSYTNPFDLEVMVKTIRWTVEKLGNSELFKQLGYYPTNPPGEATEAELAEVIRNTGFPTWFHLTSSCPMLKENEGGCVDNNLRVYGTKGRIRIVDASIMPIVPGTHTQSTVYAVAEKAADIIRGKRQLKA